MRRLWLGAALLAVLLVAGIWTAGAMDRVHSPGGDLLDRAAEAALEEDWAAAERLFDQARDNWQDHRSFTASVADHNPMDEVDGLFAQIPVYLREKDAGHFAATCKELSTRVRSMGDAHRLNWWNLL